MCPCTRSGPPLRFPRRPASNCRVSKATDIETTPRPTSVRSGVSIPSGPPDFGTARSCGFQPRRHMTAMLQERPYPPFPRWHDRRLPLTTPWSPRRLHRRATRPYPFPGPSKARSVQGNTGPGVFALVIPPGSGNQTAPVHVPTAAGSKQRPLTRRRRNCGSCNRRTGGAQRRLERAAG